MLWLAAVTKDGTWQLGLHDQTFVGWFTVVSYLVATALCLRCALIPDRIGPDMNTNRFCLFFWALTILTLFLGINKQLDLHHGLTFYLRDIAREGGWYEQRRQYQLAFIVVFGMMMIAFMSMMTWMMWGMAKRTMIAMAGLCLVLFWVILRATSFHHVDHPVDGLVHWNIGPLETRWLIELTGVYLIIVGAASNLIWGEERRHLRRQDRLIRETRIAKKEPTHAASAMLGEWNEHSRS